MEPTRRFVSCNHVAQRAAHLRRYSPYAVGQTDPWSGTVRPLPRTLFSQILSASPRLRGWFHSFKYAAAMQTAQGCANPILIRVELAGSHGYRPTDKLIAERADQWAFAAQAMGIK